MSAGNGVGSGSRPSAWLAAYAMGMATVTAVPHDVASALVVEAGGDGERLADAAHRVQNFGADPDVGELSRRAVGFLHTARLLAGQTGSEIT